VTVAAEPPSVGAVAPEAESPVAESLAPVPPPLTPVPLSVALTLDESSEAPPDGVALEVLNPKYNEFLSLAGWKATQ